MLQTRENSGGHGANVCVGEGGLGGGGRAEHGTSWRANTGGADKTPMPVEQDRHSSAEAATPLRLRVAPRPVGQTQDARLRQCEPGGAEDRRR